MIVTDVKWTNKGGDIKVGFYMDSILAENLAPTKKYLDKNFDMPEIITQGGNVGGGKTTDGSQIGLYQAWIIAGGQMDFSRGEDGKLLYPSGRIKKYPTKPLNFSLKNYCYSTEELRYKSETFPQHSVLILDEGRKGTDSLSTTSKTNKEFSEFLDECRHFGHVLIIICPDFFKISPDLACTRSMFLINVYMDKNFNRGFFDFYNRVQKDFLFSRGKRLIGSNAKYSCGYATFSGRFTSFFPHDRQKYDIMKREALKNKRIHNKREINNIIMKDCLVSMYKKATEKTCKEIGDEMSEILLKKVSERVIEHSVTNHKEHLESIDELNMEIPKKY